jgi:23S rRNA pseudouridine2605 synthase
MSTEEREEFGLRPERVASSGKREYTNQEGERKSHNQGYNKPNANYERRPYNRQGRNDHTNGYNSYGDNRPFGDKPSRPRFDNRGGGGYNNNRRSNYGDYSQNNEGGNNRSFKKDYDERPRIHMTHSEGNVAKEGTEKRRPRIYERVGGVRDARDNHGEGMPSNNKRPQQRRTNNYNPNAKYSFQKQLKYKEVLADPNEPIRLNKFLANAGVCSRREADEYIAAGLVKVNDVVVTELGTKITRQDKVEFKDKQVQIESKVYIVLNKPKNCMTTSDDPQERFTVMDLVKNACQERIYPIGRLDRNTTGVLLLTNDGDLASKLTHPSFKKKKIYHVWLDKDVAVEDMEKIAKGLELEDGEIHADAISYANENDKKQVGIEIHSGRNRIVRRIFETLGYRVMKLDRVYFAGLTKKNIGRGKWRYLNEREVNALRMGAFE